VYPALGVLQELGEEIKQVLWVGSEGGMEKDLVSRAGLPFRAIPAAGVHGVGLRNLPGNLWQLGRGVGAARTLIREFQPDVLFFTGGYVAMPVAIAGLNRSSLVYVPDIEPGLAIKLLSLFASHIAVTTDESKRYFRRLDKVTTTGYPYRKELTSWDRQDAYQIFDFTSDCPTLLVFGGSKGARSINRALIAVLPELLSDWQIIHISGTFTWSEVDRAQKELSPELSAHYRTFPYLHEKMGAALTVADLVVSRAGASTLGEYPAFGLPAILVPYPHAWRYQKVNADYLVNRGAAVVIKDDELHEQLLPKICSLHEDQQRLKRMKEAMSSLSNQNAAEEIGNILTRMVPQRKKQESESW
jgi:UDP-N-acetylglucosamine--N-acetylmuramyl-(pentapeptide) pyrophosphoryl-undecaprenol N-acetylglucosamine transferase